MKKKNLIRLLNWLSEEEETDSLGFPDGISQSELDDLCDLVNDNGLSTRYVGNCMGEIYLYF